MPTCLKKDGSGCGKSCTRLFFTQGKGVEKCYKFVFLFFIFQRRFFASNSFVNVVVLDGELFKIYLE